MLLTPWPSWIVSLFRFEPEQSLEPDSKPSSYFTSQGHAMTTLSESQFTCVVGVDVASEHLDIFISDSKTAVRIENDRKAICQFLKSFGKKFRNQILFAMEATGGYERILVGELHAAAIPCSVINATRIRQFALGCGLLEKTDTLDARIIARYAEVIQPELAPSRSAFWSHSYRKSERSTEVRLRSLPESPRSLMTAVKCRATERRLVAGPAFAERSIWPLS